MACENDKCDKYGLHHDYQDGVEIRKCFACERDNQPERSKREDSSIEEMRCSELYGNMERDK